MRTSGSKFSVGNIFFVSKNLNLLCFMRDFICVLSFKFMVLPASLFYSFSSKHVICQQIKLKRARRAHFPIKGSNIITYTDSLVPRDCEH